MKILAIDTALGACSVAILDGEAVRAHRFVEMIRGHAEALAPMVEEAAVKAHLAFCDLDRLAVTTGPGTFTGQRVGLAFMRGLRLALKRPLVGITTLEAMAAAALAETDAPVAAALHDAKRGEVYLEAATPQGPLFSPRILAFADAIALLTGTAAPLGQLALAGTAARAAGEALRNEAVEAIVTPIVQPDALWVARLARLAPEPAGAPKPLYLRPPDAKLPPRPGETQ